MGESLQDRAERLAETRFLGGPPWDFERVGRLGFEVLLAERLRPSSRVLDVGCGALRLGYWLMRFLDAGCYFGIEPQQEMLDAGLTELVEPDVVQRAQARFSPNDDFDFSVFGERFDFVIARSIWTHASKTQIATMLSSFAATSQPKAVFLASYYPASPAGKIGGRWPRLEGVVTRLPLAELSPVLTALPQLGRSSHDDGSGWVGRSHESDVPGARKHSLKWVAEEAQHHGLRAQLTSYRIMHHQYWLRISHRGTPAR
jgi:SAM-dependent methyltransferase